MFALQCLLLILLYATTIITTSWPQPGDAEPKQLVLYVIIIVVFSLLPLGKRAQPAVKD